jgi:hypothetical protein
MRALRCAAIAALATMAVAPLAAHDFWIEPTTFRPEPGAIVGIGLRAGQGFVGDPVRRSSDLIEEFIVREGERQEEVGGSEGSDPAGIIIAGARQTAIIAYRSKPAYIELPADRFEDYLRLEGLDAIVARRRARGTSGDPGLEYFTRYAKALLTGQFTSPAVVQPIGLPMEIVPDADPTRRIGPLGGTLRYHGAPLAGALVVAMPRANPSERSAVRSDARGAFTFSRLHAGVWLIKAVHMVDAGWFSRADWQSAWGSLTFDVPAAPADTHEP